MAKRRFQTCIIMIMMIDERDWLTVKLDIMGSAIVPTLLYAFKHLLGKWLNLQKGDDIFK